MSDNWQGRLNDAHDEHEAAWREWSEIDRSGLQWDEYDQAKVRANTRIHAAEGRLDKLWMEWKSGLQ